MNRHRRGRSTHELRGWCMALTFGLIGAELALALERPLGPDFIDADWQVAGDRFGCTLEQANPNFGRTRFFHEAGEPLKLRIASPRGAWRTIPTRLRAAPPAWHPGGAALELPADTADVDPDLLEVSGPAAEQLLTALLQGYDAHVEQHDVDADWAPRLAISSVRLRHVYEDYLACRDRLLPLNWRQAERTRIGFPPGNSGLTEADLRQVDRLAEYVLADASVESVYVDSYTDNRGTRPENRDLSRRRAVAVTTALVRAGVEAEQIVTRYHGERFPVADNATAAGRARNRRVTIRLERPLPEFDVEFAPGFDYLDPDATDDADAAEGAEGAADAGVSTDGAAAPVFPEGSDTPAGPNGAAVRVDTALDEEQEILDAFARSDS